MTHLKVRIVFSEEQFLAQENLFGLQTPIFVVSFLRFKTLTFIVKQEWLLPQSGLTSQRILYQARY